MKAEEIIKVKPRSIDEIGSAPLTDRPLCRPCWAARYVETQSTVGIRFDQS